MTQKNKIEKYLKEVIGTLKQYKPKKVILFGSYARGEARNDSDIDLLVVTSHKQELEEKIGDLVIDILLEGGPYFSIKIYDTDEYQRFSNPPTFFMRRLAYEGKVL